MRIRIICERSFPSAIPLRLLCTNWVGAYKGGLLLPRWPASDACPLLAALARTAAPGPFLSQKVPGPGADASW